MGYDVYLCNGDNMHMLHCREKCKRKPNRKTSHDIEAQTSFYNKQLVRIQVFPDNERVNIISYVQTDTHIRNIV